jgi:ferrous iron transport protein A
VSHPPLVSLTDLGPGECGLVTYLRGGRGLVSRLVALGFTPGALVEVMRNAGRGPIIVQVLDTQVALGRGQAMHVQVRPESARQA